MGAPPVPEQNRLPDTGAGGLDWVKSPPAFAEGTQITSSLSLAEPQRRLGVGRGAAGLLILLHTAPASDSNRLRRG